METYLHDYKMKLLVRLRKKIAEEKYLDDTYTGLLILFFTVKVHILSHHSVYCEMQYFLANNLQLKLVLRLILRFKYFLT